MIVTIEQSVGTIVMIADGTTRIHWNERLMNAMNGVNDDRRMI